MSFWKNWIRNMKNFVKMLQFVDNSFSAKISCKQHFFFQTAKISWIHVYHCTLATTKMSYLPEPSSITVVSDQVGICLGFNSLTPFAAFNWKLHWGKGKKLYFLVFWPKKSCRTPFLLCKIKYWWLIFLANQVEIQCYQFFN